LEEPQGGLAFLITPLIIFLVEVAVDHFLVEGGAAVDHPLRQLRDSNMAAAGAAVPGLVLDTEQRAHLVS